MQNEYITFFCAIFSLILQKLFLIINTLMSNNAKNVFMMFYFNDSVL